MVVTLHDNPANVGGSLPLLRDWQIQVARVKVALIAALHLGFSLAGSAGI
jgi:hypothetical protein